MSLLLDALKRAEQEKVARRAEADLPTTPPRAAGLELEPVRVQSAPPAVSVDPAPHQPAAKAAVSTRRPGLWIGAAALVLAVVAGSAYVWITINALDRRPVPVAKAAAPRAPLPVSQAGALASALDPRPSVAGGTLTPPAAASPNPPGAPSIPRERAALPATTLPTAPPPRPEPSVPPAQPLAAEPLQLARTEKPGRVSAEVQAGYAALLAGQGAEARRSYLAALAADPASVDALLGIATVEARTGNRAAAVQYYRRVLQQEPRNATAIAALSTLADVARPDALEMQLAADLSQDPGSAALHMALGNVHASQRRWTQAQAAFFEAHRLEPGNADILFNLAVSLDHLGQPRLAAGFYGRALDAALRQGAQFDAQAAARRLAEIGTPP